MSFHRTIEGPSKTRSNNSFSPLVIAEVKNKAGFWVKAKFFLDNGSNASLVRSKFAEQTKLLTCGTAEVKFDVAGGGSHHERGMAFQMEIRPVQGESSYLIDVTGVKKPCACVRPISHDIFTEHQHLSDYKHLLHTDGGEVDVLIGGDYGPLIISQSNITAPSRQ